MIYTWLGILVFALAVEAITTALLSLWFAVGALAAMICTLCGGSIAFQITLFIVVSAGCLTLYLTKFRSKFMKVRNKTNVDAIIGSVGKVEETIPSDGKGRVSAGSQSWSAVSDDGEEIPAGEHVEVLAVEGVKLVCRRTERRK